MPQGMRRNPRRAATDHLAALRGRIKRSACACTLLSGAVQKAQVLATTFGSKWVCAPHCGQVTTCGSMAGSLPARCSSAAS